MSALIRRFSRCMAAGLTAAVLAAPAFALDTVKFMAPGSVGGGYDQTARVLGKAMVEANTAKACLLYTSPSPRDLSTSRMPSSA